MASLNKAVVIGYLGKEPEVRYSTDGIPVCNVTVATSTQWKDKSGEKKSQTEWHNIVFYKQLAEIVGSHLHKGSLIYVEGKLKTRKWQNKEGQDRYTTEIVAETMQMLDGAPKDGEKPKAKNGVSNESPAEMADDIPF